MEKTISNQHHVSVDEDRSVLKIWPLSKVPKTNEKQLLTSHKTVPGFLLMCMPLAKEILPGFCSRCSV